MMTKMYEADTSDRLDKVLNDFIARSRSQIQRWIEQGKVRVDGEIVTQKSKKVHTGQEIEIEVMVEEEEESGYRAEKGELEIIYQDEHLIAVNKPSGLIVHPTESIKKGTLVNRLLYRFPQLASVGKEYRAGLAHRLDKGTSGVLLVARTEDCLEHLKQQFRRREVQKTYRVIMSGELADETLRIQVPIGYNPRNRMLRKASPEGRYAESVFDREAAKNQMSAVWCRPKTGRTHQIRVHAKYLGHPVVGDQKYGGDQANRLMLHSESIGFTHPNSEESVQFRANIPEEVEKLWDDICI